MVAAIAVLFEQIWFHQRDAINIFIIISYNNFSCGSYTYIPISLNYNSNNIAKDIIISQSIIIMAKSPWS